jgi:hypothetical protein
VTFEDFRQWALDSSRQAARRWEDPDADEIQVLLAVDFYEDLHVIPVPPAYLALDRGHVAWLARGLPHEVVNRSLSRVAYRTSAWASRDPKYEDRAADDPNRGELLSLHIAEQGRYEVWYAWISRSTSGLPSIGEWELHATDKDGLSGALPKRIRMALDNHVAPRGRTIPAADMVLGAWDVPADFFPLSDHSGPLDYAKDDTISTYAAVFRPELPGPVIVTQALTFPEGYDLSGYVDGALQALNKIGNKELAGPQLGDGAHYFEGQLVDDLYRYTALWRRANIFCEVAVAGPPGLFGPSDIHTYAEIQDRRARAH